MLDGEKILVTGATGQDRLSRSHGRWPNATRSGARRACAIPSDSDNLVAAGITPLPLDMSTGDFSAVPSDFTYVFHAAVDPGTDDWQRCLKTNAQQLRRPALSLPRGKGFRAVLDRIDLRISTAGAR